MKTILVTTDLSEESTKAFGAASALAKAFNGAVILLAVVEDPAQAAFAYAMDFPVYPDPSIHQQVIKKVESELKEYAAKHFAGQKIQTVVVEAVGSVAIEVGEYAKKNKVDVVVLASHGRSGLGRLLIGSVAERIIREAPCPVLVVPSHVS